MLRVKWDLKDQYWLFGCYLFTYFHLFLLDKGTIFLVTGLRPRFTQPNRALRHATLGHQLNVGNFQHPSENLWAVAFTRWGSVPCLRPDTWLPLAFALSLKKTQNSLVVSSKLHLLTSFVFLSHLYLKLPLLIYGRSTHPSLGASKRIPALFKSPCFKHQGNVNSKWAFYGTFHRSALTTPSALWIHSFTFPSMHWWQSPTHRGPPLLATWLVIAH